MYNNYDVEMQSRSYANIVTDAHAQRKLETHARRHRQAQMQPRTRVRVQALWFRRLHLWIARMFQPAEEPMIA